MCTSGTLHAVCNSVLTGSCVALLASLHAGLHHSYTSESCVAVTPCRYEDSSSDPERPLSVGITLAQLLVQTTDAQWRVTYVQKQQQQQQQQQQQLLQSDSTATAATATATAGGSSANSSVVHKLVSIEGLAVYCDAATVNTTATATAAVTAVSDAQGAAAAAAADKQQQHNYLLYPCSPSLRLQIRTGASPAG
jgi:ribosomal protein L18